MVDAPRKALPLSVLMLLGKVTSVTAFPANPGQFTLERSLPKTQELMVATPLGTLTVPTQLIAATTAVPVIKKDPLVPHATEESVYENPLARVADPSGLVTTTVTAPDVADAGTVTEILVSLIELIAAAAPPIVTPVVPVKFVPVITVVEPPAFTPYAGESEVTVGAAACAGATEKPAIKATAIEKLIHIRREITPLTARAGITNEVFIEIYL